MVLLLAFAPAWSQDDSLEHAVKAAYLSKFPAFVEWPGSAFAGPSSPIVLCVVGENRFENMVERAARGQTANGRTFEVRQMDRVAAGSGCHVMFASGSAEQSVAEALRTVQGEPVLTVTDVERNGEPPGIIDFVLREGKVQFAIDDRAAASNGLRISSKLLSLAVSVTLRSG